MEDGDTGYRFPSSRVTLAIIGLIDKLALFNRTGEPTQLLVTSAESQQQLPILHLRATIGGYNFNCMKRAAVIGLAVLLLIVVAAVLVSPAVDLAPATIRSQSFAFVLLMCLVLYRWSPTPLRWASRSVSGQRANVSPFLPLAQHVFELNCARLC